MRGPRIAALVAAAPGIEAARRAELLRSVEPAAAESGGVPLATCHRVEWLFDDAARPGDDDLAALRTGGMSLLEGRAAARHVIDLALGLESTALAEDQVLHQLRSAVSEARSRGALGREIDLLLDTALRAGRLARSWRPARAGGRGTTLGDVAIERIEAMIGAVDGRWLIVVGAGEMGRAAAQAAIRRGARVGIASPTHDHARAVAGAIGAEAWSMDPGVHMRRAQAVVVALSGPWAMRDATAMSMADCPVVVDLSMPPALPDAVRDQLGDRLLDIDDLAGARVDDAVGDRYRARLVDLADRTLDSYIELLAVQDRSGARRLAERIERQRSAELTAWLRHRPDLDADTRRHLDDLTRSLSARLFREPLERLASDPDGRRRRALDELFGS